ncbi:unnamed protein product [Rotaria sp. Silwood2]|nr:unnamed protein product [Rotaria sp. Silwood2]
MQLDQKVQQKKYPPYIDIYEKVSLVYRTSLLISLKFSFLPVHRIALEINIPHTSHKLQICSNQESVHGACIQYSNGSKGVTFCKCNQGWSGQYCTCSSDSLCIGVLANNRLLCVCPEGDLFSAEIQQIYQDGTLALQTRNLRYGKLGEGILVHVRSSLVKRTKNHFHSLPCGASVIRGCNGAIWICPPISTSSDNNMVDTGGYVKNIESVSLDVRKTIVRLSNCIQILNHLGLPIYDTSIMEIFDISQNYEIDELIQPKIIQTLSKHLQQQKDIINGGIGGGNGLDSHSHDMQEE